MSSGLQISLAGNITDFQEFTFISRQARWVKFTVQKVYGYSGGVGIQDIEIYNELCNPSKYALRTYLRQKKIIIIKSLCDDDGKGNENENSKVHVRTICAIKELFQIVRKINEY